MSSQPSTVRALIEHSAACWPEATYALSTESSERVTFGDLARSCRAVATLLHAHGARPGNTVSVGMPNGLATVRVLLGAMHAGLVVNPVNLLAQPAQMAYVLTHSDCCVVCVAPVWEEKVRAMLPALGRPVALIRRHSRPNTTASSSRGLASASSKPWA